MLEAAAMAAIGHMARVVGHAGQAVQRTLLEQSAMEASDAAFDAMDRNQDGFLDRAEWEAATGQILPEAESSLPAGTAGGFTDPIVRAAVVAKQTAEARMEVSIERKEAAEVARPQPSPTARTMTLIHT